MTTTAPYERVSRLLRDQIVGGVYKPGETLPSVRQLMEREETAKATIEKALRVLRDQKLIESRPGIGTVVSEHRRIDAPRDMFLRTGRHRIRLPNEKSEYRYIGRNDAPEEIAPLLGVAPGVKALQRTRVIFRSSRPVMVVTSWYPLDYEASAPKLMEREPIPEGTPRYIADCLGTSLGVASDRLEIGVAPYFVAQELRLAVRDPILYIENQVYAADNRVLEVGAYHLTTGVDVRYDYELTESNAT